jgi:hypothetical protein
MTHKSFFVTFVVCAGLLAACSLPAVPTAAPTLPVDTLPALTQPATEVPTASTTAVPTAGSTAVPTDTLPPVITATNSPAPTAAPTAAPTSAPTAAPTAVPTAAPTTIPGTIPHFAAGSSVTVTQARLVSKTVGWAVGTNTTLDPANEHVLRTADGGATWQDVTPPQAKGAGSTANGPSLQAEPFFLDALRAWVGFSPQPGSSVSADKIWYTVDGGATWKASAALSQGSGTPEFFAPGPATFLPDGKTGWLVVHAGVGMNHDYIYVFNTSDGGATWNLKVDPMDVNKGSIMGCYKSGLGFVDGSKGWLAGSCNGVAAGVLLFQTTDSGATWSALKLPAPSQAPNILTSGDEVCGSQPPLFVSAKDGFLAMTCNNFAQNTPAQTWIYVTADAGATWTPRIAPASKGNFYFLNASEGWFVGDGKVFKSANGGKTWATLTTVTWAGAQPSFLSASAGWAVAFSGQAPYVHYALVASANGGTTWALVIIKVR